MQEDDGESKGMTSNFFRNYYGPFLMRPLVQLVVLFLFLVYLAIAIYGCVYVSIGVKCDGEMGLGWLKMREGMELKNAFSRAPEPLGELGSQHFVQISKTFWKAGYPFQILITQLPDICDPNERKRINQTIG